jgi:hypothetical protein
MEKNRNGGENLIGFLSLAKNITPILITSMIGIGLITILNSDDSNVITVSEKKYSKRTIRGFYFKSKYSRLEGIRTK